MPGLVPGIHVLPAPRKVVDGRVPSPPGLRRARSTLGRRSFSVGGKPGHNDGDLRDALSLVSATSPSALALEVADVLLGVELEPDTLDQIELRLEEVDMVLLVLHQALEQVARDVVLGAVTIGGGLMVKRALRVLGGQVAADA